MHFHLSLHRFRVNETCIRKEKFVFQSKRSMQLVCCLLRAGHQDVIHIDKDQLETVTEPLEGLSTAF